MAITDLEKLSIEELNKLQKDAAKAIASFEDRKRADAIAELEEVAQKHGYKLADLMGSKKAKVASPAKYKHPEDSSLTWNGRGRQPNWIKDGLSAGKSLDDFAI
ncbi:H-NS family histone-like protein (plasmid) [Octadecabacter arcticus 238]|jgi:DNA-binding protein H-NS|uniref:H-NS family histone-like protein n=1 Tax=Octadecabacter arcticus 238 TaxID=391616 RepID=M9RQ81_9RHOB|nr:H-NS histone family protein [Octadecabacter arcticus]AGI74789.1 H-NS family histone-like protein [Octadecabacter arcticus 238]